MKKRTLEEKIHREYKQETPDILHKIDFASIEIIEPTKPTYKRIFKPVLFPTLAIAMIALFAVIAINIGQNTPNPDVAVYTEREESYTLSALSAISLLNQVDDEQTVDKTDSIRFLSHTFTSAQPTLLLDEYLPELNRNLAMVEPLIGSKESIQFTTLMSDMDEYTYKVVFSNKDMRNQTISYTMHYNETEIDSDTYELEGIMIINNVTYTLSGALEIGEDEYELEVIAEHPNEEETYVEIIQEVSSQEHTLEYTVVKNDLTLYENELSFEVEGNAVMIEVTYESDALSYTFEIERKMDNNQPTYLIDYEIETSTNEEEGIIRVEIVYNESENAYYYQYMIENEETQTIRYTKRYSLID